MPLDILCPSCRSSFPVTNAGASFHVECPSCDAGIGVSVEHPDAHRIGTVPRAAARLAAAPRVKIPAAGRPAPDEDGDAAPRGGNRSFGWVVLAGSAIGLVVVLAGVGATGYFLFTNLDTDDPPPPSRARTASAGPTLPTPPDVPRPGGIPPRPGPITPPTPGTVTPFTPPKFPMAKGTPPPNPNAAIVVPDNPVTKVDIPEMPAGGPETVTVTLPGRVARARVGGGGRYLVLSLLQPQKLVVCDLSTGKTVSEMEFIDAQARFAVGMNKLVTAGPQGLLTVYTFPELRAEGTVQVRMRSGQPSVAMGAATNGPVFVAAGNEIALVDPVARAEVNGSRKNTFGPFVPVGSDVRASHDGKLFTTTFGSTTNVYRVVGGKWVEGSVAAIPPPLPGGDAELLYGLGALVAPDGRTAVQVTPRAGPPALLLPATHGTSFLKLGTSFDGGRPKPLVTAHAGREVNTPTATLGEVPELTGPGPGPMMGGPQGGGPDQHLFFVPAAKVLAVIPFTKDKIVLRRLKLD